MSWEESMKKHLLNTYRINASDLQFVFQIHQNSYLSHRFLFHADENIKNANYLAENNENLDYRIDKLLLFSLSSV